MKFNLKNQYRVSIVILFALSVLACGQNADKCKPKIENSGNDTLIIHGLHLNADSSEVEIPVTQKYEYDLVTGERGIYIPPRKISSPWYRMRFLEKVNGYNLTVTIYPEDTMYRHHGLADYHFHSDKADFRIQLPDMAQWYLYRKTDKGDYMDFEFGKTYDAVVGKSFVQADEPEIHYTPFCFKDVDFDGEKELCFMTQGYNRHYFLIFKLLDGKPYLIQSRPYNNIVYSDYPEQLVANTLFDYNRGTISIEEQFGRSSFWQDCYIVDKSGTDPMMPMTHLSGSHTDYSGVGSYTDIFENGYLKRQEIDYNLSKEGCTLVANYSYNKEQQTLYLTSVEFSTAGGSKETLYPAKSTQGPQKNIPKRMPGTD